MDVIVDHLVDLTVGRQLYGNMGIAEQRGVALGLWVEIHRLAGDKGLVIADQCIVIDLLVRLQVVTVQPVFPQEVFSDPGGLLIGQGGDSVRGLVLPAQGEGAMLVGAYLVNVAGEGRLGDSLLRLIINSRFLRGVGIFQYRIAALDGVAADGGAAGAYTEFDARNAQPAECLIGGRGILPAAASQQQQQTNG